MYQSFGDRELQFKDNTGLYTPWVYQEVIIGSWTEGCACSGWNILMQLPKPGYVCMYVTNT